MKEFLDKYASLSNKNNPIIIHFGKCISDQIFNKQITKKRLDKIVDNIRNLENTKINITYNKNIKEYRQDNHVLLKTNSSLDYSIYNINDRYIDDNLYFIKYNIQNNEYITPSFENYESIENYDLMNINVNNILDVKICDYKKYYICDIIIKKPNNTIILSNLLEKIFKTNI